MNNKPTPPSIGEFAIQAIEERAELLARIEAQAREIEYLQTIGGSLCSLLMDANSDLAALKAQPSGAIHIVFDGPPGPECGRFVEAEDATGRSINAGEWSQRADGYWQLVIRQPSGVVLPERKELDGNGGWRDIHSAAHNACLDEVARLNSPPVSAGVVDERGAFEVESGGWWNDDHNIYTWPITVGEWGARIECHGHNPAEAQQLAISIARAAQPDHSAQSVPDWISISDRMPQVGQWCLIKIPVCGRYEIEGGKYLGEGVWAGAWCMRKGLDCAYKVSDWMPEPGKQEGE